MKNLTRDSNLGEEQHVFTPPSIWICQCLRWTFSTKLGNDCKKLYSMSIQLWYQVWSEIPTWGSAGTSSALEPEFANNILVEGETENEMVQNE